MHTPYLKFRILEFIIFDDYMNNFKNESFSRNKKFKNESNISMHYVQESYPNSHFF